MKKFNRRLYGSFGEFVTDVHTVMSNRKNIRGMLQALAPAFRERLFLAVTQVNGCRYYNYFHARQALMQGISEEEIRAIGDGLLDKCPAEELTALCYAQHWAETDAKPAPETRAPAGSLRRRNRCPDRPGAAHDPCRQPDRQPAGLHIIPSVFWAH